jgi:hypothetical protein
VWLVAIVGIAIVIFLGYNIKVWGLPLVLVSILIASYTIATVMVWYVMVLMGSTNISSQNLVGNRAPSLMVCPMSMMPWLTMPRVCWGGL